MDDCSKDVISTLPDTLLCQILSNLSTKEAALTSILSKRWRYLFAFVPNLDFDAYHYLHPENKTFDQTSFIDFVDRVLRLRGDDHVNKFSLKCGNGIVDEDVYPWIANVLRHGVSDLVLDASPSLVHWLPSKIFASKTLVSLKIGPKDGPIVRVRNVCLPKLKTLQLDSVEFEEGEIGFAKLISGCPLLEELSLCNLAWDEWDSCSVVSKILKRLRIRCLRYDETPKRVLFDTPNVVYFEYSDYLAHKYPKLHFDSLVEARIVIRLTHYQAINASFETALGEEVGGNATDLLMAICNVKTLKLSYDTLGTLDFCCQPIPVFNNLTHLTIKSHWRSRWESLPDLLKSCPNLETLVFKGLLHKGTYRCGDVCLCLGRETNQSCLSSSPVKFIKIMNFGESEDDDDDLMIEIEMIKNFLEKMPNLEQLMIYYNSSFQNDLVEKVSNQLQKVPAVASLKCKIQLISDNP